MVIERKNDPVLQEDLEYIVQSQIEWSKLKNTTLLVTGATGLVGSQIILAVLACNRLKKTNISIVGLARNKDKATKIYGELLEQKSFKMVYCDILNDISIMDEVDYIIHSASVTESKFFIESPVETIKIAVNGTMNILDYARTKNIKGIVYLSSMEAFGMVNSGLKKTEEKDLGYIDISNIRSCYSESKRMCECMCASYASEYKLPVRIARLSQTFGAGVSYKDKRVFAQFAKSVITGNDIVLHTKGESFGNYTYLRDTIIAILILLTKGNDGEAYTVTNEESNITIADMAKMVAENVANNKINVIFDIPASNTYGYAPDVKLSLSSKKMQQLGWKAEIGLKEAYERMIESMKATIG